MVFPLVRLMFYPVYPRALSWGHSYFYVTSMTYPSVLNLKYVYSQMIAYYTVPSEMIMTITYYSLTLNHWKSGPLLGA